MSAPKRWVPPRQAVRDQRAFGSESPKPKQLFEQCLIWGYTDRAVSKPLGQRDRPCPA